VTIFYHYAVYILFAENGDFSLRLKGEEEKNTILNNNDDRFMQLSLNIVKIVFNMVHNNFGGT